MIDGSVLFYVQHLLGIGHLRRALRLVDALARAGIEVTLVSGGEPIPALQAASVGRLVQLPPIRARDATFRDLVDTNGEPVSESLRLTRRAALLSAFAAAQHDAIVIEAFPFGRRALRFELDALIDAARSRRPRPLILCSLRDIVVVHDDGRRPREIVGRVRADFDFVLVHGDPGFVPLDASFPLASEIADRLVYTGYIGEIDEPVAPEKAAAGDEVLVSVGGGAVGNALLSTALESRRRGCLASLRWRLLAGPNLPEAEFKMLAGDLPGGVVLERYRADFPEMLRTCRVSVSQAGYNTVLDILAARTAAVVVPFSSERETEQSLRAERLAARGVVEIVPESELSPERLCDAIHRAITRHPAGIAINTAGARQSATAILEMIRSRRAGSNGPPARLRHSGSAI